jgi:hypothetical protein
MTERSNREAIDPRVVANDAHAAALGYAEQGWSVIPIEPRGKRPLVGWREFQHQRADAAQIDTWFAHWPDANVGIVTGRVSGLVVIDVDARHGGFDSLQALQASGQLDAPTVEAATGGGGRHFYLAHPRLPLSNRVALLPGIDLRADGGCVVAPPSRHPSGRRYAWVSGRAPGQIGLAALPESLAAQARRAERAGHPRAYWRALIHQGIAEGRRNDTLASLAGHLLHRGVDLDVTLELLLAWNRTHCRPPLPDEEVVSVAQSIARLHEPEAEREG